MLTPYNTNLSMIERNNDVQDQQVLNVSWNKVIFRNGNVIFSSPYADKGGKGKIISWKDSLADFELIKPALQKKIPSITIRLSKWDIIEVINFDEITNAIISLKKSAITHKPDVVIKKTSSQRISYILLYRNKKYDIRELRTRKSLYFLSKRN